MSLQELRDLSSHLETGIQFVMNRVSQLSADGGTGWAQEYTRFSGINGECTEEVGPLLFLVTRGT